MVMGQKSRCVSLKLETIQLMNNDMGLSSGFGQGEGRAIFCFNIPPQLHAAVLKLRYVSFSAAVEEAVNLAHQFLQRAGVRGVMSRGEYIRLGLLMLLYVHDYGDEARGGVE